MPFPLSRRVKISHDPRNLAWSQSTTSFGQRFMAKHGWKEGQSLGNRDSAHVGLTDADRLAAARVGILFKDDGLGLGAKRKSPGDVESQLRVGLDAFQGLLGRLNGKSEVELQQEEKKVEDRRLEMYAKGRWGGMVFVRGGVLVGSKKEDEEKEEEDKDKDERQQTHSQSPQAASSGSNAASERAEKRRIKEEKRQRKEERRKRKEDKASKKLAKNAKSAKKHNDSSAPNNAPSAAISLPLHKTPLTQPADEPVSSPSSSSSSPSDNEAEETASSKKGQKRRHPSSIKHDAVSSSSSASSAKKPAPLVTNRTATMRNGRHLLRGRNIQAKRMAFADVKGLDEIFMTTAR